jgi:hypothetical protein
MCHAERPFDIVRVPRVHGARVPRVHGARVPRVHGARVPRVDGVRAASDEDATRRRQAQGKSTWHINFSRSGGSSRPKRLSPP